MFAKKRHKEWSARVCLRLCLFVHTETEDFIRQANIEV